MLALSSVFLISLVGGQKEGGPPDRSNRDQAMAGMFRQFVHDQSNTISNARDTEYLTWLYVSAPSEFVTVRFLPDESIPVQSASAFVSMDGQQSWSNDDCVEIAGGFLDGFWECDVNTAGGTDMSWYLQLIVEGIDSPMIVTQSPENIANSFPTPDHLLATVTVEEEGDVIGEGNYLDITGLSASYSNDALFVQFQVAEGGFFEGEFFGPWYLYGAGFSDPEQGLDSDTLVVYSLGYGNGAFGNLYPGLLKLWGTNDGEIIDYAYVTEDIVYSIDGNVLSLAVATHYITDDQDFGNWPNSINGLLVSGLTASTTLDIDFVIFDSTDPGMLILDTQFQNGNAAPVLSAPTYSNETAMLSVDYFDGDGNIPTDLTAELNGSIYREMQSNQHDYTAPVAFFVSTAGLFPGENSVEFHFSDGSVPVDLLFEFTVSPFECVIPGDVNNDGTLDVLDIVASVYIIIELMYGPCADMNADDLINVQDIILMVDHIVTGGGGR